MKRCVFLLLRLIFIRIMWVKNIAEVIVSDLRSLCLVSHPCEERQFYLDSASLFAINRVPSTRAMIVIFSVIQKSIDDINDTFRTVTIEIRSVEQYLLYWSDCFITFILRIVLQTFVFLFFFFVENKVGGIKLIILKHFNVF